jgi:hypothetical protein
MSEKRRQHERDIVISFPVGIQLDDSTFMESQIFDCTVKGAFIRCDLAQCPNVGTTVLLRGEYRRIPYSIEAMVKWKGHSATHDCEGFGIEFTHEPTAFRRFAMAPSVIPSIPAPDLF